MWEGTSGGQLVQTLLLKQGNLELVVQDNVQTAFEDLHKAFITSPTSLQQCSITLTAKKCFLMSRGNLLSFSLWPHCLWSYSWTLLRRAALPTLHPPLKYFSTLMIPPRSSPLQDEQFQLSQPLPEEMLQTFNHSCDPSLCSFQYVHISLVLGTPELDSGPQLWPQQCWI